MTKSELIELLSRRQPHLKADDVDLSVKSLLQMMGSALAGGERIEVRGFGSFSLHFRPPRTGRNPKTGDAVALPGKHVPHFKPGKELRERVNGGPLQTPARKPRAPSPVGRCRLTGRVAGRPGPRSFQVWTAKVDTHRSPLARGWERVPAKQAGEGGAGVTFPEPL